MCVTPPPTIACKFLISVHSYVQEPKDFLLRPTSLYHRIPSMPTWNCLITSFDMSGVDPKEIKMTSLLQSGKITVDSY